MAQQARDDRGAGDVGDGTDAAGPGHESTSTIEWLELFFDLVVVAAVAVLTEGLREEPTWAGVGLFALLYVGIWFSWVQVVLYAIVAGSATRTRTILVGMFLVAVMAATAPIHFEQRANAFAIAFVVLRVVTSQSSIRTGRILQGWPLLQFGGATLPWIVAIWVDTPWKYVLWALGLGLDLGLVLLRGNSIDDQRLAQIQERFDQESTRRGGGRKGAEQRARAEADPVQVSVVTSTRTTSRSGWACSSSSCSARWSASSSSPRPPVRGALTSSGWPWRRSSSSWVCGGSPSATGSAGRRTRGWRCCSRGSGCRCTC